MARSVKSLLGGRYKLSGEFARAASVRRAWDRWLNRPVFINIFTRSRIDGGPAKRRFIESAQALVRIDHPNVEALLDYGATEDGAPYHVMREGGVELASLTDGRVLDWASVRRILLDVIAGVDALHRRRIVHGDISLQSVALFDDTARLVDFSDAVVREDDAPESFSDDVRGIAALGFCLLTGLRSTGRAPSAIAEALARSDAPPRIQAVLLRALAGLHNAELATLERELAGDPQPTSARSSSRVISAAAAVAAAAMLSIGLWASFASAEHSGLGSELAQVSSELVCEPEPTMNDPMPSLALEVAVGMSTKLDAEHEGSRVESSPERHFDAARASVEVGSEALRKATVVETNQFDLYGDLSPAILVERGIDLTHGRPTPDDDPRVPIVDGPARARVLFEAACARSYGKGCHMLGVQIAEGMIDDDGAGPVDHYRHGCALDYHRSCAALADLARAGEIVADVSLLDAKACLLAGPASSYCLPK